MGRGGRGAGGPGGGGNKGAYYNFAQLPRVIVYNNMANVIR
jgi:hypothetical protein